MSRRKWKIKDIPLKRTCDICGKETTSRIEIIWLGSTLYCHECYMKEITTGNAVQKSVKKVRTINEIRQDIDTISEKIIRALAERKKYGFNSSMYAGSGNTGEFFILYGRILEVLCHESPGAAMTPEVRALDKKAMLLIKKRIALGAEALALKRKSGIPLRDPARENELIMRAGKIASECGMDSRLGARIMGRIIKETVDLATRAR